VVASTLTKIADAPCPLPGIVLTRMQVANFEKWDWVLPDDLYLASCASRALAIEEAYELCKNIRIELEVDVK
jgi:ATP-dependent helicase Lhr and Lhr-like helicase